MNEINQPVTISEFITSLNDQFKQSSTKIIGEVCQVKFPPSGHVYFTIKDKTTDAVLDAIIWKSYYDLYNIEIEIGMELILNGCPNIYPATGRISFVANSIELVGEGVLLKNYNNLKQKLAAEGLFAQDRKRKIPEFPINIGVITSKQGAVIHDFMNNLSKHGFKVNFINSKVEGHESLFELHNAISRMSNLELDVIVLMRGGGSLQSLAAFDNENLVRLIVQSKIPIIAAIGHHQDIPLCALAADSMASTPTAAANMLSQSWERGLSAVHFNQQNIFLKFNQLLSDVKLTLELRKATIFKRFNGFISILRSIEAKFPVYLSEITKSIYIQKRDITQRSVDIIRYMKILLNETNKSLSFMEKDRIFRIYLSNINEKKDILLNLEKLINLNNPNRQLALGYSLVRHKNGAIIKSVKDVTVGNSVDLTVFDGIISAEVEKTS